MSVILSSQRFPLEKELKNTLIEPFEFVFYLHAIHSVKLTKIVGVESVQSSSSRPPPPPPPNQKLLPTPLICLIIVVAPGWPRMPWFWDLVQLSTKIPLQLLVSTTLLKQSHNYVLHSNPQQLNLHAWCLGADNSKNKASLWRWQREFLPLKGLQRGPSTSRGGPCLRNGAEKIRWISPLPL